MNKIFLKNISVYVISGADPGFGNGGGSKISSKASYTYKRSEYTSAGGGGGAPNAPPPRNKIEFRTPQSESEHNLTNYFIIFLLLFY